MTLKQSTHGTQETLEEEVARLAREAEEEEERQDAKREQDKAMQKLKIALEDKNLAICIGSGVTLYSTAQTDEKKTILSRLTWTGLIKSGLRYLDRQDIGVAPESRDMGIGIARQVLDSKNASTANLLDAANILPRLLGKHYATWLALQFDDLASEVNHPSILTYLNKLHKRGATIMTTNYDGLVEKWCDLPAVDGSNPGDVARWKRKQLQAVFHPHGYWMAPDTIVLTTTDYYKVQRSAEVQSALQSILGARTVLFVGCGEGLNDPNFGKLLDEIPSDIGFNHYILLPGRNGKHSLTPVRDKPVITVRCNDYDDIGPWLAKLLGEEETEGVSE